MSNHTIRCNSCNVTVARTPNKICVNCQAPNWGYAPTGPSMGSPVPPPPPLPPRPNSKLPAHIHKLVCKNCSTYVAATPDDKCINCGRLNWGYTLKQVIDGQVITKPINGRAALIKKVSLISAVVAAAAVVMWMVREPNIYQKYENSIGLIYNAYYLAYVDNGDTLYLIGPKGVVDMRNAPERRKDLKPFEITGSGFYVSDDGHIITNKHVAAPWESDNEIDKSTILQVINKLRVKHLEIPTNSTITGVHYKLGIWPNNAAFNADDPFADLRECHFIKATPEKDVDLAVIQINDGRLPSKCTAVTDIISSVDEIHVGDDAIIVGYPFGTEFLDNGLDEQIKATENHGHVSKVSKKQLQYDAASYSGASGSPIFNQHGKLIAINWGRMTATGGFNFGATATQIQALLNK